MDRDPIDERKKFVEAWNKTMLDIWQERIFKLKVMDSGSLWRSPLELPVRADGRFYDITLSQTFLEFGLWQDIGRDKKRVRRRWFSTKYYASVMALRDFIAESLGQEFVGMFANLDADDMRRNTDYYRRKGLG